MPRLRGRGAQTVAATLAYTALTIVMEWPLPRGLAHDVPADLGDSLLVMGLMSWVSEGLVALVRGDMGVADLWNGYFFYPAPLTLTYSEHFIPQAVQGLPVYLMTGNAVAAYNVVLLATFVLSGLGTFLWVRALTGSAGAAFVAGLFYAFFPYRVVNVPHLHTLSSQWMPLTLYGVRRYFDTGRLRALAGGVAAFVAQALSTGYYLFFFAPVLAGYVLWEVTARGRWRHWPTWTALGGGGAVAVAAVLPFLLPYARAREAFSLTRPLDELTAFSADLFTYAHATAPMRLWGPILYRWGQPEGGIFPGLVPVLFGGLAILAWTHGAFRGAVSPFGTSDRPRERVVPLLLLTAGLCIAASVAIAVTGGTTIAIGDATLRATSIRRPLEYAVVLLGLALWRSPWLRDSLRRTRTDLTPFLALALMFSVVMSLGPQPRAGGRPLLGAGLYQTFYDHVPGYAGLRVPARFGMVAGCLLAGLAGYGLTRIASRRYGTASLVVAGGLFLAEAYAAPLPVNLSWSSSERFMPPWPTVHRLNDGPLAYRHVLLMPPDTVLLELPFGDAGWDLRYVYYAGLHGKRLVNGYSGYFPDGYRARAARLHDVSTDPAATWAAIMSSGATHVLLHRKAYPGAEAATVWEWLFAQGAVAVADFDDGDLLVRLPASGQAPP